MKYAGYYFEKELSKERMLRTVLIAQGEYLAKKSSQRLTWWSSKRWSSAITPKPSENRPLWSYEENLPDIYLLNLTLEQLKTKVFSYWEKPGWKQWLLRLWTPISQQIEAWSYYQQCLAFREIQKNFPKLEPCLAIATHEKILLENLAHWFVREEQRFQRSIENRSYHWLSKHFETQLHQHERKRAEKFLKQLEKELAKLPKGCEKITAREKAQTSYQEVENVMHGFRWSWHHRYSPQFEQQVQSNSEEWYIVSSPEIPINPEPIPTTSRENRIARKEETIGLDSSISRTWLDTRRQTANALLLRQESTQRDESIKALLQESLIIFISFIEPQLDCLLDIGQKVYFRAVEPKIAIEVIESMQPSLMKYCRQGALLFHPDHFQKSNTFLHLYWNGIFVRYKKFYDDAVNRLGDNQKELGKFLSEKQVLEAEKEARKHAYKNLMRKLDNLSADLKAFKEEMMEKFEQDKVEIKAILKENGEEIIKLRQMIEHHRLLAPPTTSPPIETTEAESNTTSFSFKA